MPRKSLNVNHQESRFAPNPKEGCGQPALVHTVVDVSYEVEAAYQVDLIQVTVRPENEEAYGMLVPIPVAMAVASAITALASGAK